MPSPQDPETAAGSRGESSEFGCVGGDGGMRKAPWKTIKLEEVVGDIGIFVDGDWVESKDQDPAGNARLTQLADIGVGDFLDRSNRFMTSEKATELKCTFLKEGDVLVARMPDPIGRACIFPGDKYPCVTVVDVCIIRPNPRAICNRWLMWTINSPQFKRQLEQYISGTTRQRISRKNLQKLEIPLPPLEEQRRIAAILDQADGVRRKRKEAIALTEELLRSAFLEMFGDPVTNPKGWEVVELGKFSKIQGGLQVTTKRKDLPLEVPYLRVANVYRDKLVLDEIKYIRVNPSEVERINLKAGDLLIVEGHGNNQEIGRSSVWDGSIENCVHQNHLIRVRIDSEKAEPIYISAYLNSPGGRRQLTKFGKTTSGLNTISTSNIKATKVVCPPIEMQRKYLDLQHKLTKAKDTNVEHLENIDDLFNSLLQRAFRGEL